VNLAALANDPAVRAYLARVPREAVPANSRPSLSLRGNPRLPATAPLMEAHVRDLLEVVPLMTLRKKNRRSDRVRIRFEVMQRLIKAGFTDVEIGGFLNRNRRTVQYYRGKKL
jgi:hypothetical protein